MGSAGASVLAASLPSIPGLESVYLDQCGIGDEGARALAAVMPQCPSLLRLYIFSNPIGPAGKSALEAAIPELYSVDADGVVGATWAPTRSS